MRDRKQHKISASCWNYVNVDDREVFVDSSVTNFLGGGEHTIALRKFKNAKPLTFRYNANPKQFGKTAGFVLQNSRKRVWLCQEEMRNLFNIGSSRFTIWIRPVK